MPPKYPRSLPNAKTYIADLVKNVEKRKERFKRAHDALQPMGFNKVEIDNTIVMLLEEYGSEDCWFFIEDNGYNIVIDTLIDRQELSSQFVGTSSDHSMGARQPSLGPNDDSQNDETVESTGSCSDGCEGCQ